MELNQLDDYLPQQPPIRMIQKVYELDPGQSGIGQRFFHEDDPCFAGHFPGNPILPGVLITEAFAQTAMVILRAGTPVDGPARVGYLAKINNMSFHRSVLPGQSIDFQVTLTRRVGSFFMVDCLAREGTEMVAKGSLTLSLADS